MQRETASTLPGTPHVHNIHTSPCGVHISWPNAMAEQHNTWGRNKSFTVHRVVQTVSLNGAMSSAHREEPQPISSNAESTESRSSRAICAAGVVAVGRVLPLHGVLPHSREARPLLLGHGDLAARLLVHKAQREDHEHVEDGHQREACACGCTNQHPAVAWEISVACYCCTVALLHNNTSIKVAPHS